MLDYQFCVALDRAKAGQHREAWTLVRSLRPSLAKRPALYHVRLAVVCSRCLDALDEDAGLSTKERAELGSTYGGAGVEILRHAIELLSPAGTLGLDRAVIRPRYGRAPAASRVSGAAFGARTSQNNQRTAG